ncbi:unnamed protein product, partial [Durusdinium trenchii]
MWSLRMTKAIVITEHVATGLCFFPWACGLLLRPAFGLVNFVMLWLTARLDLAMGLTIRG